MKKILVCSVSLICCLASYTKQKSAGVYVNESRTDCVVLFDDKFIYMERDYNVHFCGRDVFGSATYNWIDSEFIELHDVSLRIKADESIKIKQRRVANTDDSLEILLALPQSNNQRFTIRIWYTIRQNDTPECLEFTENRSSIYLNCKLGKVIPFKLPLNIEKLCILIAPESIPIINQEVETYLYYGLLYYRLPEINVKKRVNSIIIEVPAITEEFFLLYHLNGEYVRIQDNKLIWRGIVFEKSNLPFDSMFVKELAKQYNVSMDDNLLIGIIDNIRKEVRKAQIFEQINRDNNNENIVKEIKDMIDNIYSE